MNKTEGTDNEAASVDAKNQEAVTEAVSGGTPYDDAFRTMTNDCADLLIFVVNEIFKTKYTYLFNREKDFKECEDDDERLAGLLGEVSRLVSRLDAAVEEKELTAYQRRIILEMGKVVLRQLARNYRRVKEGAERIMGGNVIDLEVRRIYQEGDRSRLMIDAKAMLEDGLEPERVARILKVTEEELAQLTGNAASNAVGNAPM